MTRKHAFGRRTFLTQATQAAAAAALGDHSRASFDEAREGRADELVHGRFGDRA